jgi:hypothetical protein
MPQQDTMPQHLLVPNILNTTYYSNFNRKSNNTTTTTTNTHHKQMGLAELFGKKKSPEG